MFTHRYQDSGYACLNPIYDVVKAELSQKTYVESTDKAHADESNVIDRERNQHKREATLLAPLSTKWLSTKWFKSVLGIGVNIENGTQREIEPGYTDDELHGKL